MEDKIDTTGMLNPEIRKVKIGRKDLREITLYPLSLADERKLAKLIGDTAGIFFNQDDQSPMSFVAFATEAISENLPRFLAFVADDEENHKALMKDITNAQLAEIASAVYDANFGVIPKNLGSLKEMMKGMFPSVSERLSPQSANDMADIGLKTSLEKPGEKEESPVLN